MNQEPRTIGNTPVTVIYRWECDQCGKKETEVRDTALMNLAVKQPPEGWPPWYENPSRDHATFCSLPCKKLAAMNKIVNPETAEAIRKRMEELVGTEAKS